MTRILITGANSFVGYNFRKFSHFKDIDEVSLIENMPEDLDFSRYDVILHVAAIVHQTRKIPELEYFKVNRDLCIQTAEYAKKGGIKQFVFLSTLKVYGDHETGLDLRDENSQCFPDDSYGRSKYEAEKGLRRLDDENFTVSVIRPAIVYGKEVKANMLSIVKLISICPLLPFRNVENKRDFIYVENLISLIDRIIEEKASGIFIAKDDNAISTSQLVKYLSSALGKKTILFTLPKIFIRVGTFFLPGVFNRLYGSFEFDNTETKKILVYNPPYTTKEGIEKWINN